jgi:hypothetical protein
MTPLYEAVQLLRETSETTKQTNFGSHLACTAEAKQTRNGTAVREIQLLFPHRTRFVSAVCPPVSARQHGDVSHVSDVSLVQGMGAREVVLMAVNADKEVSE